MDINNCQECGAEKEDFIEGDETVQCGVCGHTIRFKGLPSTAHAKHTFGSSPYFAITKDGRLYDRHGKEVDPGECVIFKVTDKALPDLLDFYGDLTENKEHRQAVARLADEVYIWQKGNDRVKAAN